MLKSLQLFIMSSFILSFSCSLTAQRALLWEISGNGIKKPSYLYGTMHVSNKVAFHLSDTFFVAIKGCQAVALESSPETWLDELIDLSLANKSANSYGTSNLYENGFKHNWAENTDIAQQLAKDHGMINQMLYRFRQGNHDFEENTYLDLFIFQTAKKLKKEIVSLEDANEAMKLVVEGSIPDGDTENRKRINFHKLREAQSSLEKAYRNQDLQLIDSLNKILVYQPKMFQNLIVKRNQNFADNIDSIIQHKSMFSAVGAAHLPGDEGVIEMLREKGYTMRPVIQPMIIIGSKSKSKIEQQKYNISYKPYLTEDSLLSFDVPAKCISFPGSGETIEYICTEFVNGAFFSLSRSQTYGNLLGQNRQYILKRIDSLLYENIPGKILKIKEIAQNGIKGYSILNKTKRGEFQRYNIYVTPLELLIFKVGAPGSFAKTKQSERFFNSIQFNRIGNRNWSRISLPEAGYSVYMPSYRSIVKKSRLRSNLAAGHRINAFDWKDSSFYSVSKSSFHDFEYIEEDTFELRLLAKKYAEQFNFELDTAEFATTQGYPSYIAKFTKNKQFLFVKVIIQGPHYYLLSAKKRKDEMPGQFFNSFSLIPYTYPMGFKYKEDSLLNYTVKTVDEHKSSFIDYMMGLYKRKMFARNANDKESCVGNSEQESFFAENSSELISLEYTKFHKYYQAEDSLTFWDNFIEKEIDESLCIKDKQIIGDSLLLMLTDTNSIRAIMVKSVLQHGVLYTLKMVTDTITKPSQFARTFFASFTPDDSLVGYDVFENKIALFASDLASGDSLKMEHAKNSTYFIDFKNAKESQCKSILTSLQSVSKIDLKERSEIIDNIAEVQLSDKALISELKKVYIDAGDTSSLQLAVLNVFSNQKKPELVKTVPELLNTEIPLSSDSYGISSIFFQLSDSLELSKDLFPALLEIAVFPEYRDDVYALLAELIDSSLIDISVIMPFKNKIKYDAKIELKRQLSKSISGNDGEYYSEDDFYISYNSLDNYQSILMPFYKEKDIHLFFEKALQSDDNDLKMSTALKLLENNKTVDDTIWQYLSKKTECRLDLYNSLEKLQKLDLFDTSYLSQKDFCFSELYRNTDTIEDSVIFIGKRLLRSTIDTGYVYFYKYKAEDDDTWAVHYCGVQPVDQKQLNSKMQYSYSSYKHSIDKDGDIEKIISEIVEQLKLKYRKRVAGSSYYNYDYDLY